MGGQATQLDAKASLNECIKEVLQKVPDADGVTYSLDLCEARVGQLYVQKEAGKHNCFINPKFQRGMYCIWFDQVSKYSS